VVTYVHCQYHSVQSDLAFFVVLRVISVSPVTSDDRMRTVKPQLTYAQARCILETPRQLTDYIKTLFKQFHKVSDVMRNKE